MAVFNNVSVLDTIAGPYATNWSQTAWSVQNLVSSSVVTATGGTYELKAPEKKDSEKA